MNSIVDPDEKKIGSIELTSAQKKAITAIVDSPNWTAVEDWARQRQVNIAVAGITVSQGVEQLFEFKGKTAESRYTILSLRQIANDYHTNTSKKS